MGGGGLIFGRAFFWEGLLSEFYGIIFMKVPQGKLAI